MTWSAVAWELVNGLPHQTTKITRDCALEISIGFEGYDDTGHVIYIGSIVGVSSIFRGTQRFNFCVTDTGDGISTIFYGEHIAHLQDALTDEVLDALITILSRAICRLIERIDDPEELDGCTLVDIVHVRVPASLWSHIKTATAHMLKTMTGALEE